MKKILVISSLFVLIGLPVLAALPTDLTPPDKIKTFPDIVNLADKIINYLFTALLIVAIIFIILSAFSWLTAAGDTVKTGKAREQLLYAIIALAIGALAKGLVYMVANLLEVRI